MEMWKAVVLGIVQGLAEFLPISSSGHLAIIKEILKVDLESGGLFFDVMLHLGTLLAIFVAYWRDVKKLVIEGFAIIGDFFRNFFIWISGGRKKGKKYRRVIRSSYRKFVMMVIVSTIPTGIIGVAFKDTIELAGSIILVPGICLLVTAVFLTIADLVTKGNKKPRDAKYSDAFLIGLAQGVATMPGISRSGSTITAGLLCGFEKKFAVKYSFIMSIPAVMGAVVLELKDFRPSEFDTALIAPLVVATILSAVVGYLAINFMVKLVQGKGYRGFAIYCTIMGLIAIVYGIAR